MTTAIREVRNALARHPFTHDLAPRHLDLLTGMARLVSFPAGAWIARVDEEADSVHLVVEGCAAIEVAAPGAEPLTLATVHEGEVLGWSWLFPPHRLQFDVVALDDVTAIVIDGAALRQACDRDHELGYRVALRLVRTLSSRLGATRLQLVDVYGTSTNRGGAGRGSA
jgi:CRP/FNR family transcriptional regulator, cyclic AMP receptor protein